MTSSTALTLATGLTTGAMTIGAPPASSFQFTRSGAEAHTAKLRRDLTSSVAGLIVAREGGAWSAMGYPTWHDYCEQELGNLAELAIPAAERMWLVASMKEAKVSNRPIAERLGCSVGTVSGDLVKLRAAGWSGEPAEVVSADGSVRSSRSLRAVPEQPDYSTLSRVSESAARVAAQEERGLTSIELDLETDWPMGTATGNLSTLERRGWLRRTETFRAGRAAYVVTIKGQAALEELLQ